MRGRYPTSSLCSLVPRYLEVECQGDFGDQGLTLRLGNHRFAGLAQGCQFGPTVLDFAIGKPNCCPLVLTTSQAVKGVDLHFDRAALPGSDDVPTPKPVRLGPGAKGPREITPPGSIGRRRPAKSEWRGSQLVADSVAGMCRSAMRAPDRSRDRTHGRQQPMQRPRRGDYREVQGRGRPPAGP